MGRLKLYAVLVRIYCSVTAKDNQVCSFLPWRRARGFGELFESVCAAACAATDSLRGEILKKGGQ